MAASDVAEIQAKALSLQIEIPFYTAKNDFSRSYYNIPRTYDCSEPSRKFVSAPNTCA